LTSPVRTWITGAAKKGLYYGGAFAVSRRLRPTHTAVILRYHSVCQDGVTSLAYIDPGLSIPVSAFEQQMRFLRERYTPVSLEAIVGAVADRRPLPPRAVAVTFDDGYRDNLEYAFGALKKHDIPGVFYITAGCVEHREPLWTSRLRYYFMATRQTSLSVDGAAAAPLDLRTPQSRHTSFARTIAAIKSAGKDKGGDMFREVETRLRVTDLGPLEDTMLTWAEVRALSEGGMTIGAHTLTHPNLPGMPPDEAAAEIGGSKTLIEQHVAAPVLHFAYPNGRGVSHFNEPVREMVRKAGFLSSVTSINGPVLMRDDPFTLKRLGIYRKHADLSRFALDIERTRFEAPPD